jgi:DnaJ-class molecular chaperone
MEDDDEIECPLCEGTGMVDAKDPNDEEQQLVCMNCGGFGVI